MIIRVNHPWFDDMKFKLNNNSVVQICPLGRMSVKSADYNEYVVVGRGNQGNFDASETNHS